MAEAMNELTLLAMGIYGHPLPKQHGALLRLVVLWKYGFKSIKSIARIEFTTDKPRTFWHSNRPEEYDFVANVRPDIPHPRWSQATEKLIDTGEQRVTLPYNGYEGWVAKLYV
jgi:sulfoxide reductase catalytic subunit YedY